ncbi:MAG: UDP-N-acetylmuramoyl-tripeptide--D-alanyl-D-alanine ligase [Lachnospiraceae bacterium]|nr:UDP-N-acetylmuramoyl-tripeptide--D-alanyl-D-alanine ligase [Candidatus Merdinaster equi]
MAAACGGKLFCESGKENTVIGDVHMDSRKIMPGDVFVAAKGERVDGHDFISSVYEKGASCVVCETKPSDEDLVGPDGSRSYIIATSSIQALKDISAAYRLTLRLPVIGITGSVGKTTTKEFIAAVLEQQFDTLKTEGNQNNTLGLPMMVMKIKEHHQAAVLEMGISDFGEMHELSRDARPDICVITNIGQCHLEFLHTRDGILKAKTEIFDYMSENATVILNGDDDKLSTLQEVKGKKPIFYGLDSSFAYYADEIKDLGLFGSDCILHTPVGMCEAHIPLPGQHMIYNALAACAVGVTLGMELGTITEGLAGVRPLGGRCNILRLDKYTVIDDCYNASPASMRASLDLLNMADSRKVAVLGDMFELGDNEKKLHEGIGSYAADKADILISAGGLSECMHEAAVKAGCKAVHFADTDELMKELPGLINEGDTILIKASHGMGYAKIVEMLKK